MQDYSFLYDKSIIQTISLVGGIQGLILSAVVLFFYPRIHRNSNILLSLFILSVSLVLLGPRLKGLHIIWLVNGLRFTTLMLLYLYIRSLYRYISWKSEWWNILVLLLHLGLSYLEWRIGSPGYRLDSIYSVAMTSADLATILFYFILLFKNLGQYRAKIEKHFSTMHHIGYHFSYQLVIGFLAITSYQLMVFVYFTITANFQHGPVLALVNNGLFMVFLYFITIRGKLSPLIYKLRRIADNRTQAPQSDPALEPVISNDLQAIAERVTFLLKEEKVFLNPELTLRGLAEKCDEKSYLVSQAINQCLGKSFFELINSYRVEEAQRLMLDSKHDHLSLLGVGFEAGFNSKTTFNTTFKRITGMTPNEFKKQHLG
ncbi:MAG: AraC family transcriptional regulator [Cryomorphaceae bacterium]|nr:MAG: AraC family transcriptional regulator [Cryomorphaceae bacterium]